MNFHTHQTTRNGVLIPLNAIYTAT